MTSSRSPERRRRTDRERIVFLSAFALTTDSSTSSTLRPSRNLSCSAFIVNSTCRAIRRRLIGFAQEVGPGLQFVIPAKLVPAKAGSGNPERAPETPILDARLRGHDSCFVRPRRFLVQSFRKGEKKMKRNRFFTEKLLNPSWK